MKIDPDDALEKVCRTLLTQIGLGLAFVYALRTLRDGLLEGMDLYTAYFAMLGTLILGGLSALMALKVFHNMGQWVDNQLSAHFRPSVLLDVARIFFDTLMLFLPIVAGYQVLHFARMIWK